MTTARRRRVLSVPIRLAVGAFGLLATASCGAPAPMRGTLNASGRWSSASCEPSLGAYGTPTYRQRSITLTATTFDQTIEYFDDVECTMPTLTQRIVGTYTVGAELAGRPGVFPVDFARTNMYLTPRIPRLAAFLMMMGCGSQPWTSNVEQETTATACVGYPEATACPRELELLSLANDRLAYGARPSDGNVACTEDRRATALETTPLVRAR
jgi:hypothetical protein